MLEQRILEISYKHKLSHLSSCLTALPIIDDIYSKKGLEDNFVLSAGHAGLALYVVLEKYLNHNAEMLLEKHGVHPNYDAVNGIDASTGSLGQGLPLAVGMAVAGKETYCLISDGECAEGSIWESLAIAEKLKLQNLHIYLNLNGFSAYDKVDRDKLTGKIMAFEFPVHIINTNNPPGLDGVDGHYKILDKKLYQQLKDYYDKSK